VLSILATLALSLPSVPAGGESCRLAAAAAPDTGFSAHEWGTFTSVEGSDGISLEGLQHEEEGLPAFVYSRSKVRACPLRDRGYKGLEVDVAHVTRKMETPVIYFHSKTPQRVRVRVCFQKGLLSQWFPVTDLLGPPEKSASSGPLDVSTVDKSFLEWEVDVLSPGDGLDQLPTVDKGSPWAWQRSPASNLVRTVPRTSPRAGPVETERFLFYRGVGSFDLPLHARTSSGSRLHLVNEGKDDVPSLFVLHVENGRGEFRFVDGLRAGATADVARPLAADAPSVDDMIRELVPALVSRLVDRGLFGDEAEAMARTWEKSYFRTDGLRVLYVVPDAITRAILPLDMQPEPTSLVRVLVGRLECIAPEKEAEVRHALLDRLSTDPAQRAAAEDCLARLGRFLEPHLRRAVASSTDAQVVTSAKELLAAL
jgi:hypothetical protein